jgi:hypothetical protein
VKAQAALPPEPSSREVWNPLRVSDTTQYSEGVDGREGPQKDLIPGASGPVAESAKAVAAPPPLGPLVRSRWGDGVEIFENSRLGAGGFSLLMGLGAATASLVLDLTAQLWGPWKSLVFGIALGLMTLPFQSRGWRQRRRFIGTPLLETIVGAPAGALVRLTGTIEPEGKVFTAPGSNRPVVYARAQFWEVGQAERAGSTAREDIRGVPFRLRLDDGSSVRVNPAAIQLLDVPRQVGEVPREVRQALGAAMRPAVLEREPRFLQATLAPGDRIEVVGHLSAEVSVHGDAAPVRGSPLVHTLLPPENGAVWVRRQ